MAFRSPSTKWIGYPGSWSNVALWELPKAVLLRFAGEESVKLTRDTYARKAEMIRRILREIEVLVRCEPSGW